MSEGQSTSVARQISVRTVVEAILRSGPVSRAELARITGLSKQTASEVVRALESGGWIRPSGQTQGFVGRSAVTYELQENSAFVLGVDLGGTKVHVAVANLLGVIVGEDVETTERRGGRHVIRQIRAMVQRIARRGGIDPGLIRCGAMGSPGVFQPDSGRINIAPNIPGLDEIDVARALREELGVAVAVENDVNLAAMGERWQGCGREASSFAFLALGTGIGMGIISEGQLVRGARGGAGEIAYLPLGGDPFDARGYRLGTLESAIGSVAILERYRGLGGDAALDVRGVFDRMQVGEEAAVATIEEVARLLAQTVMAIRAMLDPELVVLGGSIGSRPELVTAVRALLARFMPAPLRIETSALGSRAALVGGIGVALDSLYDALFGLAGVLTEGATSGGVAAAESAA